MLRGSSGISVSRSSSMTSTGMENGKGPSLPSSPLSGGGHGIAVVTSRSMGSSSSGGSPTKMTLEVGSGSGTSSPKTATDAAKKLANADNQSRFKLLLLIMMVLQNSSTVLVGRYTRSAVPESEMYEVNHLILVIELGKLLLACALEFYATQGQLWTSLQQHIFANPADAMKISVPALLYLVQNTLLYVALSNLTAPIFQVTYQAKLVTTAIVSVLMLQRAYSVQQWVCLVFLSLGVAIVVLGEKKKDDSQDKAVQQNLLLGLTSVSIACFSSALAGVYFEKVLKKPHAGGTAEPKAPPPSLWMRNIQLAFFSVIIAVLQGIFQQDKNAITKADNKPYLHGFTAWAWVLVALQAGGGLLVAAVIKYADNVLKGLATGVSVVVATSCSMVLFGTPLTTQFCFGAALILSSVYFFSNPLPFSLHATGVKLDRKESESMLPK